MAQKLKNITVYVSTFYKVHNLYSYLKSIINQILISYGHI